MMVVNPAGNAKQLNYQLVVEREGSIPPSAILKPLDEMARLLDIKSYYRTRIPAGLDTLALSYLILLHLWPNKQVITVLKRHITNH
ncbi:hypothetical protein UF06_21640 [Vibrio sp. S234-5]|nr:hypothetical protein UF06_21640 [Vibrio sp. S234-5]